MKKFLFFVLMMLTSIPSHAQFAKLGDINHDNDVTINDVMMLVDIVLNGYKPFSIETSEVAMEAGESAQVNITGGYDYYEVTSANPNVVKASLDGSVIMLSALSGGETTVTVKDVQTFRTIEMTVKVSGTPMSFLTCPDANHPHMIDLGLPSGTKWACCNVDTDHPENQSPTNYGGYYAWGETETKTTYDWSTYIHCDGSKETCHDLGSCISGTQYDVSHVKWGGFWQMPTIEQQEEMLNNCTHEWTTMNNVYGWKFTSSNGGSIFLPATGCCIGNNLFDAGNGGGYWSGTLDPAGAVYSSLITVYSDDIFTDLASRYAGFPVRPVALVNTQETLALASSKLSLAIGYKGTVNITSGSGSYSVDSNNESVAKASIDGSTITVTAIAAGSTSITVTDTKSNETATIEVTVSASPTSYLTCPDNHHPHMIDLGLPTGTKWACCNVDTDHPENQSPTNYGGYYAWGETETKTTYDWTNYTHCDGSQSTCHDIGSCISGTQYDVAHVEWAGSWQMPTQEQQEELINNCTHEWTTMNNVNGLKFTSSNGGSIFLPAVGYRSGSDLNYVDNCGAYWAGTLSDNLIKYCAIILNFTSGTVNTNNIQRFYGMAVRPVAP